VAVQVTKADIQIAVKGINKLKEATDKTNLLSKEINKLTREAAKDVFKKLPKDSKALVTSTNNLNKSFAGARKNLNKVALGTGKYFEAISDVLEKEEKLSAAIKKQRTDFKVVQRLRSKGLEINNKNIQLIRDELAAEIKLARAKKKTAQANLDKGKSGMQINAMRGLGGAVGSGIIGGGFPLLFGQGPTAAIGGALGGVAGGALSAIPGMGQFGFALSIAGTTIGGALDELTKALAKPTENIETLVKKLGLVNTETGDLALRMNELGMTSDASALLLDKFAEEFGLSAEQIKENTTKMNEFNNEINKLGTSLTLLLSKVLGPLIEELNNLIQNKKPQGTSRNITGVVDFFTANAFDLDKRGNITDEFFNPTGDKFRNPFDRANDPLDFNLNPLNLDPNKDKNDSRSKKTQLVFEEKELLPLKQALDIEKKRLTLSTSDLNLLQEKFKLTNIQNELKHLESQITDENNTKLNDQIAKLKIVESTQEQIVDNAKHLSSNFQLIGRSIASGITDNLSAAIMQTKTLGDAAKSILNDLSSTLIKLGVNTILGGLTGGAGGIFGSLPMLKFASGGRPPTGRPSLVGEKGPELFVPKRSGTIIPNDKLGGGGSTNISVNVDASGSSVQGDEQQSKELGRAISAAIQAELLKQRRSGGLLR